MKNQKVIDVLHMCTTTIWWWYSCLWNLYF